jgi:hypothetical protein
VFRRYAIDDGKWGSLCASVDSVVIGKLYLGQCKISLLRLLSRDTSDKVAQVLVDYLCLTIYLRMTSVVVIQRSVKLLPQSPLEVTEKLSISIRGNGLGHSMQTYYLF